MGDGLAARGVVCMHLAEGLGAGEAWTSETRPEHQSPPASTAVSDPIREDLGGEGKRLGLESIIMESRWGWDAVGGMSAAGQKEASRGSCEAGEVGQFLPPASALPPGEPEIPVGVYVLVSQYLYPRLTYSSTQVLLRYSIIHCISFARCFLLPLYHWHLDLPVCDLILLLPPGGPP